MDIIERLKFDATRCEATFSRGVASNITAAVTEIEHLRELENDIWEMLTDQDVGFADRINNALAAMQLRGNPKIGK